MKFGEPATAESGRGFASVEVVPSWAAIVVVIVVVEEVAD